MFIHISIARITSLKDFGYGKTLIEKDEQSCFDHFSSYTHCSMDFDSSMINDLLVPTQFINLFY